MLISLFNFNRIFKAIATVFLVGVLTLFFSQKTFAATGILKQINFQGKVVNANGTNVTNGNYDFVFNIYTVATAGTAIWTETRTVANQVTVTDGIFRVSLGSITALPGSIDFNTDNIYLGINFNSDGEMTPRVQFTAVPYAFNALKVAGLTVTDTTGTFTLAAAKTLTVNNTLTLAGTDATTVTFQGTDTYVGRATTDTLTNKTFDAPKFADLGYIADSAGNEMLVFDTVATAVPYLQLSNNSTGLSPVITGAGEANTGIDFATSGTGAFRFVGNSAQAAEVRLFEDTDNGTNYTAFKVGVQAGNITYTLPTAVGATNTFLKDVAGDGVLSWATIAGGGDMVLADIQTVTGAKTFGTIGGAVGKFILAGSTSGSTIVNAAAVAGATTITLPGATDTLVGKATTDIFTNKTFDTAGTGNVFQINGTGITAVTGTGSVVLATSPTLVTPVLGAATATSVGFGANNLSITTNTISTSGNNTNLILAPNGTGTTLLTSNYQSGVQIGTAVAATPLAPLYINGGIGSNGALIVNQTNLGDLLTASASGTTKFTVSNDGNVTAGTYNGNTITTGTGILTLAAAKTLTVSNTLTFSGTDGSSLAIGTGGTLGSNAFTSTAYAPLASPTFTGTVTIPTPFTIGAISMTSTGTQLNYLNAATGTTGTTSTNVVFSTSPTLVTPVLGAATGTSLALGTNPAAAGTLRIPNATYITARNAANSADINLIQVDASNLVSFGANTAAFTLGGTVSGNSQTISGIGTASFGTNNLSLTGTTISTSGNNADLTLAPNGTGDLIHTLGDAGQFAINATPTTDVAGQDSFKLTLNPTITGSTQVLRGLVISQSDNANTGVYDSLAYIENLKTPETTTNGLLIEQNAASGTLTNGLQVLSTAGTLTSGLLIADGAGTTTNGIQLTGTFATALLDTPTLDITAAGNITGVAASITGASGLTLTPGAASGLTLGTTGAGNTTSITLATDSTGDAEVVLPAQSISAGEILNDTITSTQLNSALTFSALDFVDLGLVVHNTTANQGLRLPNAASATPSNPTSGEGYLAWDTAGNQLITYNGTSWATVGGGGGYNLIKDETTSLTARTTLAFLGTAVTCADNAGLTQTECTISGSGGGVSFASGTPDNTVTSNNLIHLQKSGVNKFVISNSGGLTLNGTDSSVVRTTTAEFATGTVGSNLTNSNDQLELSDGTVPNSGNGTITTAGQPVTSAAIGAGAHATTRSDASYLVIRGGGTGLDVYDSIAGTFTNSAQVLTGSAGAGALSLPRPDGRYRVAHCGGLTTSSLVDPRGTVAVGASVAFTACNAGTVSFKREKDGRFIVFNGGGAVTQIYNPVTDAATIAGPTGATGTFAAGSLVIPRPDGKALIVNGGSNIAITNRYNPNSGTGDIGVMEAVDTSDDLPAGCEINGAGSIAIRKPDGKYIIMSKVNSSVIYDPVAGTMTQVNNSCTTPVAGSGPRTTALADGAHAIPLQNGKFLIVHGGATTDADIYDPSNNTFTAHGTALTAGGAGRHSIMRANGTWQMINGGGTGTNNFDTGLPMTGTTATYTSDDISTTSLNASSTIRWNAQLEVAYTGRDAATNTAFSSMQFLVRTAVNAAGCTTPLNSATDREILKSGDLIRPGSTDNCIRITVKFNRPVPKRVIEERGTWTGNNSTVVRFDYITPTLFDVSVDNSTVLRRNSFDFTNPNAGVAAPQNETSGPLQGRAEVTLRAEATGDKLYLPHGRLTPLTNLGGGTGSSGYYPGVISGAHPNLSQTTTDGTIVIARDDKQFLVISNGAANASLYDPSISTFTAQSGAGNIPTAAIGTGAHAIKRPDGKFLIVLGGATTTTNIYDPRAASGSRFVAGPAATVAVSAGSHSILNGDGTFTILHGGAALSTSIYNPVRNTMIVGPATPVAINCGSWAIPRPQYNHYLIGFGTAAAGTGVTTSSIYDANTKIFSATAAAPTLSVAVECGSFVVQRPDGLWWYPAGDGLLTSAVYNPAVNRTAAGPAVAATGRGAHAIPRADGTIMIVHGNAGTATSIYVPWGGTNSADVGFIGSVISTSSPALATAAGAGALSFQRPDGKWVIIVGGATASAVTQIYDAGWYADGQYLSEQVQVPALAAGSTLEWKQTPDNFVRVEVRTAASQAALGTTSYASVGRSGQSIGNAGGETWVQVQINFRRDFPTFCGNLDGVYASTGGMAYCNRTISVPTVFEYKLNNGMDLMNLQNNGLSMFRVTSSGNVYTGNGGTFLAGGADLAENYTSKDSLEKGEVVVMDKSGSHGVKRSQGQYQNDILGVVSTAPGFVAGGYTEDSYPIALVGRVPVRVSTENGLIKAGDYLTSASIPGYAMKANQAGRVLGKALEDLKESKECPAFGMGNLSNTQCGEVMVFVNLTDYLGSPVELVMEDQNTQKTQNVGLSESQNSGVSDISDFLISSGAPSVSEFSEKIPPTKQDQILAFLKQLKEEQASESAGYISEVFTDRVSAVNEIITPHVITELLTAKKIKADSIEGLEILTSKILSLSEQVAGVATSSAGLSTSEESKATSEVIAQAGSSEVLFESVKITLDMTVLGKLNANGGLIVLGLSEFKGNVNFAAQSTFQGETVFEKLTTFLSNVIFKGKVTFEEAPTFNKDTAGSAIVTKETDQVVIVFEKEYEQMPFVTVGITLDTASKNFADKTLEEQTQAQEKLENDILSYDLKYFVTKRDSKGFIIRLNKKASLDVPFSWHAIVVKDSIVFKSKSPVIEPTSVPSPTPSPLVTVTPTLEPSISPSQEASPSASSGL